MTQEDAFKEINDTQDYYIQELVHLINSPEYKMIKTINFTSPTGTGKTEMMAKLISLFPDYYFVITTLSKGQLHIQIRDYLNKRCLQDNFTVYGSADYKINSRLDAKDIINRIPEGVKCIWLRDEGHIRTNRFDELLIDVCYRVINFSATNINSDIQCNFTHTMMLRTVNQTSGTPENAIDKLLEVKKAHKNISGYNPCAIFRCVGGDDGLFEKIVSLCKENGLKYIDITNEPYIMAELCEDDNPYDVIINKFKIVEGIDIRRAHVLYMDNQPKNNATTIQAIGRCRRNALLYRDDIDILAPENRDLLEKTRECYVYYNVDKMNIDTDENGELQYAFCNCISCEALKTGSVIEVIDGQLMNGLFVIELKGCTGKYIIERDESTGFNVVSPETKYYDTVPYSYNDDYIYTSWGKIRLENICKFPLVNTKTIRIYNRETGDYDTIIQECEPYYNLKISYDLSSDFETMEEQFILTKYHVNTKYEVPTDIRELFHSLRKKYTPEYLKSVLSDKCIDILYENTEKSDFSIEYLKKYVSDYLSKDKNKNDIEFFNFFTNIGDIGTNSWKRNRIYVKDCCNEYEMLLIQYYCIKNQSCMSIKELRERIKPIISYIEFDGYKKFNISKNELIDIFFSLSITDFKYDCMTWDSRFNYGIKYPDTMVSITEQDVYNYFKNLDNALSQKGLFSQTYQDICRWIESNCNMLGVNTYSFERLFIPLSKDEERAIKNKQIEKHDKILVSDLDKIKFYRHYDKTYNDRESAIIGTDLMRQIRTDNGDTIWTEAKAVTSKIGNYNKLNRFISSRYSEELEQAKLQYFTGKNNFNLDKKCNSVIGYCTEYYSKYLVYGESYMDFFIEQAKKESKSENISNEVIVRACMLKYKALMINSFGSNVVKVIPTIKVSQLIQQKYQEFVDLVIKLGTKTAEYVKSVLYPNVIPENNIDPNLSIRHIAGLADYITTDTILDIKVLNHIDEKCVRQVLAYHYLSTKRSDLSIKKVIVYDVVSEKSVKVNISEKNISAP